MLQRPLALLLLILAATHVAAATEPYVLQRTLSDPGASPQISASQGFSVAVEGGRAVAGAPTDDVGGTDAGVVKVYDAATGALLNLLTNPAPAASDQFGWSVAISGMRVVVGARFDDASAANAGIAYIFDLASATPAVPVLTLTNPGPASGEQFGYAVGISGVRVVVGTPFDDTGTNDAGSAYVFDLSGPAPHVPVVTLTNPVPAFTGGFGLSVSISGAWVVIGANGDDTGADNAGSAYVYDLNSATPDAPAFILNNPGPGTNDQFGLSVAVSGTRVVVGAWLDDTGTTNAGSAYVYELNELDGLTPAAPAFTLNNPAPAVNDDFGRSVSISGTRVVIGAFQDDTAGADTGSAYVYDLTSLTPTNPVVVLTKPDPTVSGQFGWSVALSGARVIVSNPSDNISAGAAYSYDLDGATPDAPVATLNFPSPASADYFGIAMAISGRLLIVGATGDDTGTNNAGRAYVYDLDNPASDAPVAELDNPAPAASDNFGAAVAISGTRVVVGASGDDAGATDAGSAYVYELGFGGPPLLIATLNNPAPASGDNFGAAVAIAGTWVVVGTPRDGTAAPETGTAYVYDLTSPTPALPAITLTNPTPAAKDSFGSSVAMSGTRLVVGDPGDDLGANNAGRAYIYNLTNATPALPEFTLNNPGPIASYAFGSSVAISSQRVVIGNGSRRASYAYDLAGLTPALPVAALTGGVQVAISGTRIVVADAPAAYLYDLTNAVPGTPVAVLTNPAPAASDQFGRSVAIEGVRVAIGVPSRDGVVLDRGAVCVFTLSRRLHLQSVAAGMAMLSWEPAVPPAFVLQYTDGFSPGNWLNAPSGATNPVSLSTTNAARFYRVIQP